MRSMFEIPNPAPSEKVILAGLITPEDDPALFDADLQEMQMLCDTAGADVVKVVIQKRDKPESATFLGKGKIREIKSLMNEHNCKTFVLDAELSPGQVRNIENITNGKIIDRSQLILDIFAHHARTNEARIQVELAQMRTLYPRLTHAWSHFSQQVGGIGTTGPGEKQLEVDRRLVQRRITDLSGKLKKIEKSRHTQRKGRKNIFRVSLVGYTNVGKSSLLNALSGANVLVENQLFATLDTSTRRTFIPDIGSIVISDTVGFLRKLPHQLVASFKSTLEVVQEANLLLMVMDASCGWTEHQQHTVREVLDELGAHEVPRLLVFNKMDLIVDPFIKKRLQITWPNAVFVSAFRQDDMSRLKVEIAERIKSNHSEQEAKALIKRKSTELQKEREYDEGLPEFLNRKIG
ncbi:MAG: GTPase HflX [Chitinivibrionales bacterium]|nr:GTPase HflX [Chitinivibrionales bacterium]